MGETLMQRRRVSDEVFRYVKLYQQGRRRRKPEQDLSKKQRLKTCQQPRSDVGGMRYADLLGVYGAWTGM